MLPAFVAEMDLPLAPAVTAALREAVETGDCGYANDLTLGGAFAAFADARWSWRPDPRRIAVVPDVMGGVARAIEILTAPGDGVVLTPPVYGPFRQTIDRLGRVPVDAPMRTRPGHRGDGRWTSAPSTSALAAGARAVLLCNPHNPTGSVPTAAELAALRRRRGAHRRRDHQRRGVGAARPAGPHARPLCSHSANSGRSR